MESPTKLGGQQFERLILSRAAIEGRAGKYTLGRYGTITVRVAGRWSPVPSLPDFEGIQAERGSQFIFDAKVCSQAAFPLSGGTSRSFFSRQYSHLIRRSRFGALTFILLHFNARTLKTKSEPAGTFLIPVVEGMTLWKRYDDGWLRTLTRDLSSKYGISVSWGLASPRTRLVTPDFYTAICSFASDDTEKYYQ